MKTACLVIIGNEILSGRTQDAHTSFVGKRMGEAGIALKRVYIIPDDKEAIKDVILETHKTYDYVLTTGGIGATHDDITAQSIAEAFDIPFVENQEAVKILGDHYGHEDFTPTRRRMCMMPEGVSLIPNPVTAAPGFQYKNIFVLAGVPSIMNAMYDHVENKLTPGDPILFRTISSSLTEGMIALELAEIQNKFPEVEIGSYPHFRKDNIGVSIVIRTTDASLLESAAKEVTTLIESKGYTPNIKSS